jgi:hypothetical protein
MARDLSRHRRMEKIKPLVMALKTWLEEKLAHVSPIFYTSCGGPWHELLILLVPRGRWRENVVPRLCAIFDEFGRIAALCAHQHAEIAMYFRRKTSAGRAYLQIVESRRRRPSASAGDRDAGTLRGSAGERPAGTAVAFGRAVRGQGHGAERGCR